MEHTLKLRGRIVGRICGTALLALAVGATCLLDIAGFAQQSAKSPETSVTTKDLSGNPCDEMGAMAGMSVMGESMAAMANHMCMTPMRAKQTGDDEKARAVVAQVKATMEKYKDYKKTIADGFLQAN